MNFKTIEACIGYIGIRDICHFDFRDWDICPQSKWDMGY